LIDECNRINQKHKKLKSLLNDLTDYELMVWIAGYTLDYGREWDKSIENAQYQLEDRQEAIERFSGKSTDLLGMVA